MPTTNLMRSGGVTVDGFYSVFGSLLNAVFSFLGLPVFGIPLYVIIICIAVVAAIFALLSNKKGGGGS